MLSTRLTLRCVRDLALLGLVCGSGLALAGNESLGASFLLACLWAAFNLALLSLLISSMTAQKNGSTLLVLILVCAKIPASYLILLWLLSADFTDLRGLVAGLVAFPVVLIVRGLLDRPTDPVVEEGR